MSPEQYMALAEELKELGTYPLALRLIDLRSEWMREGIEDMTNALLKDPKEAV